MKKVIFAIGLVVLLASCSSSVKEEVTIVADSIAVDSTVVLDSTASSLVVGSTGATGVDSTKK